MKTNESQRRYLRELESTSDQKFMPMGRIYLSGLLDDLDELLAENERLRKSVKVFALVHVQDGDELGQLARTVLDAVDATRREEG